MDPSEDRPVIEKDSLVLVTGVNGFVASHVADQLLQSGYRVRGTTRTKEKSKWLHDLFNHKYGPGKFETVEVPDMAQSGAFDQAVLGVQGIIHLASVMDNSKDPEKVIDPSMQGAINVLRSAHEKEPNIKSFVLTSSSAAVYTPIPNQGQDITDQTFNQEAIAIVYNVHGRRAEVGRAPTDFEVYAVSKWMTEGIVWNYANGKKVPFQVAYVLPNVNFGPILKPNGEDSSSTANWITRIWDGDETIFDHAPPQWFIDVRDTARLHVAALIDPSCNGQRLLAFAQPFNFNDILAILRKQNPGKHFMDDKRDLGRDLSTIPNQKAIDLLRKHFSKEFTSLEDSILATTESLRNTNPASRARL